MEKKPTDELDELLENMKPNQLDRYFKENRKYLADEKKAFYYYMKDTLAEKNIKLTTVEDIEIFKALLAAKRSEWLK